MVRFGFANRRVRAWPSESGKKNPNAARMRWMAMAACSLVGAAATAGVGDGSGGGGGSDDADSAPSNTEDSLDM